MSENLWPFKAVFSSENSQKSHRAKSGEYGRWSNFIIDFFVQKLPDSEHVMSKGIVIMQDQAKVQVFSDTQPHVTLTVFPNNNAGSLFDLVQETQSEQFSSVQ
jgi:hypothetical protein